jgi:hypothetical protein
LFCRDLHPQRWRYLEKKKLSNPDRQRLVILQLQKKNKNWVKKFLINFYGLTRELSRDITPGRAGEFAQGVLTEGEGTVRLTSSLS